MNSLFRISCRNISHLPTTALCGFDTRLSFAAQSLVRNNTNFNLVRSFHVTAVTEEEKKKSEIKREKYLLDPRRNRTAVIPVETSIKYLQSKAYKECYGDDPVWKHYRRNHPKQFPPKKTRKLCIRNGVIYSGNPCPICRDEYLIVDYRNIALLKQFISQNTGEILSYEKTGVCQKQHQNLLVAYLRAKDLGLITFDVPFREYNYSEYELK